VEPLLDKEVQTCCSQRGVKAMAVKDCASVPGTPTRGERQPLVQTGESEAVLALRRLWQKVVRTSCSRAIEELTGGQVVGFMSDDHIDPDIAAGVLMLEPVGADPVAQAAIAVAE
jgi:uncharacterized protein YbcI